MHNTQFKKMVDSPSQHRDAKTKCIGVMLLIILLPLLYHFIQVLRYALRCVEMRVRCSEICGDEGEM